MAEREPLPGEIAVVWSLFMADAVAILVTYSRLPAYELYHVSGSGLEGGLSRVLVDSNFPAALVAIPILLVLLDRVQRLRVVAVAGIVLCLPVFWPGVVDEANLDARPVNAVAAIGVLVALVLSLRSGFGGWSRGVRGDGFRDVAGTVAVLVALPWLFAEL